MIPNTGANACTLNSSTSVAGLIIGECAGGGSDGLNLNGNTLTVDGPITVKSNAVLNLTSGTLVGTNTTVINGCVNWIAATLSGNLTLATNGIIQISDNNDGHRIIACLFTNYGTVLWTNDSIQCDQGTVVYNYGLWVAQDNQTLAGDGGGTTFNNYGTFKKTGGAPIYPGTCFDNESVFNQLGGIVDVQNGTNGLQLWLQGGGNFTGGKIIPHTNGYVYLGSINGSGQFTINGTVTSTNTIDLGAALVGTNVIQGGFNWSQGYWSQMSITIASNTLFYINNPNYGITLYDSTLTNFGTVYWSNIGIQGDGGSIIANYGLWDAQDNQTLAGGAGTTFNNYGTFEKTGGANVYAGTCFNGQTTFNQLGGIVDVQNGTNGLQLWLQGAGSFTGGSIIPRTNGYIYLGSINGSGKFTINGTVTTTNTIDLGAALVGTNVIQGGFNWSQGYWSQMSITIASNTLFYINNPNYGITLYDSTLTNFGTVYWSNIGIQGDGGSIIANYGLWDAQDDQQISGGAGLTFYNYGTFEKTGGTGNYPGTYFNNQTTFTQAGGLINLQTGLLTLAGQYSLVDGTINFNLNNQTNFGSMLFGSSVTLGGTISATLNNNFAPSIGEQFQVLNAGSTVGTFNNANLPQGLSVSYPANAVMLTVVGALPFHILDPGLAGNDFIFQIPTATNQSYTVLQSTNLINGYWTPFTNLTGNGSMMQILVPTTNYNQDFFRVIEP